MRSFKIYNKNKIQENKSIQVGKERLYGFRGCSNYNIHNVNHILFKYNM